MLRRLLTLVVLVAIVGVAVYMWRVRQGSTPALGAAAQEFGREARGLGAEARDKLGAAGEQFQDAKVTAYVKTALGLNRSLRPYSIEVSTENGVVTLRGRIEGEALRARAESVTAEVPGVTQVVNQLQAAPGAAPLPAGRSLGESVDDHTMEIQIATAQRALQSNPNLASFDLRVREEGGRLVLRGQVRTPAEKDLAGLLAREGAGGPVENAVEVRAGVV